MVYIMVYYSTVESKLLGFVPQRGKALKLEVYRSLPKGIATLWLQVHKPLAPKYLNSRPLRAPVPKFFVLGGYGMILTLGL